jgi:hypothetical protein
MRKTNQEENIEMKPHKHAELIHAWADGAVIERLWTDPHYKDKCWLIDQHPTWEPWEDYRIKPEPKPDRTKHYLAFEGRIYSEGDAHPFAGSGYATPNLKLFFDGETGELKSAEVLK